MFDYKKYFDLDISEDKYCDSILIIKILEDIMSKSFTCIKNDVTQCNVFVDSNQIEEYLNKKFEIENLELRQRIEGEKPKKVRSINFDQVNLEYIRNSSQEFIDGLEAQRYAFSPYTLEYFKTYVSILKRKISRLLDLMEKIAYKDSKSIQQLLDNLDIKLDDAGNILKSDIIRLIKPTIYNIKALCEQVNKANDLSTYLTFKMTKHSLCRDGIDESEIYPNEALQVKNLLCDNSNGCIPLSENQEEKIRKEYTKRISKTAKMVVDCFDRKDY